MPASGRRDPIVRSIEFELFDVLHSGRSSEQARGRGSVRTSDLARVKKD
jgi:hypothetical protein